MEWDAPLPCAVTTATTWANHFRIYCRAHGIDPTRPTEVKALDVQRWILGQAQAFRDEPDGVPDFEGWLEARFPEKPPASSSGARWSW